MCLLWVNNTYEPNDNMIEGYKVFKKRGNRYYGIYSGGNRIEGKSYNSTNGKIESVYTSYYDCGFHAYRFLNSAQMLLSTLCFSRWDDSIEKFALCKVHLWDIRALGKENRGQVYVGKHMRIIKEKIVV